MANKKLSAGILLSSLLILFCATQIEARNAFLQGLLGPLDCVKQNDTAICDDMEDCTWCDSGASAGTGCYPLAVAKVVLPKRFFKCDKLPEPDLLTPHTQHPRAVGDESCDKKSEDSCIAPDCVWCTSAAVGGGCYTPDQAKLLPSAIFKCKTAPSMVAA